MFQYTDENDKVIYQFKYEFGIVVQVEGTDDKKFLGLGEAVVEVEHVDDIDTEESKAVLTEDIIEIVSEMIVIREVD